MSALAALEADWRLPPWLHQFREFEGHADAPARALLWTMRTGKTKAEIDKACHLFRAGKIDGVLIFAPNGVHANWIITELPEHCWPGIHPTSLIWRSSLTGKLAEDADKGERGKASAKFWATVKNFRKHKDFIWFAVNSESMIRADCRNAVARFLKHKRVFVIFDESDDFGTPGTKRTKMARALARRAPFRSILSGTTAHTSPLAVFSQFELLEKKALGFETYGAFKNHFADFIESTNSRGQTYKTLVGFKNLDVLQKRMAKFSSVVNREDCPDLPETRPEIITIKPSPQQRKAFNDLRVDILTEIRSQDVSIGAAAKLNKLQQVFSGFVIDEFKETHLIPGPNPRLDALEREAVLLSGKAVVWCNFQMDMELVKARFRKLGFGVVEYHGRMSPKAKAAALAAFRSDPKVRFLVGHPKSGGRGLDMSAAGTIFWYSQTFSARARTQAMERATKMCGPNIRVVDFIAPGPDKYILRTVQSRMDVADALAGTGLRKLLQGMRI